jgi:hypothetical protein|tara:strand:+ start:242 stop:502 length:261 start_codon:yes stop_codon:yes gene_type:complete
MNWLILTVILNANIDKDTKLKYRKMYVKTENIVSIFEEVIYKLYDESRINNELQVPTCKFTLKDNLVHLYNGKCKWLIADINKEKK